MITSGTKAPTGLRSTAGSRSTKTWRRKWAWRFTPTAAIIIGWKIFESNLPAGVPATPVRDAGQMFALLARDRVDVALHERWQGLAQARDSGLTVRVMEPPLVSVPMHMYLHKKHAALVPRVSQALVRLKQNGTYQRLAAQTLQP